MPEESATAVEGGRHFAVAWHLAAMAWLGCVLLQLFLYLRPSPYGEPFLLEWRRYFLLALYYEMLGVWLLSAPFFFLWLIRYRRPVSAAWARRVHTLHAGILTLNLFLSQLDHEVLRFLGIRLSISFIATYVRSDTLSDSLFLDVLRADPGGAIVPVLLLVAAPALYGWSAWRLIVRRCRRPARRRMRLGLALMMAIVPFVAPANAWQKATGKFRLRKVEPVAISLMVDAALGYRDLRTPHDFKALAADYQARWLHESIDKNWRFPDPRRPYLRVPAGPSPKEARLNVILVQLETVRGVDVGVLNPGRRPSPTPFLDRLAAGRSAAVYSRALSFGQPSINGTFAAHCSITPHSRRFITSFTHAELYCLPEMLRRRGYRTAMFNAGDTDWDGSTHWFRRWYDELRRYPQAKEHDRPVFRDAARRIRALGTSGRPFLATIVSVSNHTPFASKEPRLDIAGHATPRERILNTTRYTDDVLGELVETLRGEPWFARTIIVIFGDHGFNLGEHDGRPGQQNLYRESLWVPLAFLAEHPRLRRGIDTGPASLLDIAPTIADLIGIREAIPWQGHSLLARSGAGSFAFRSHGLVAAEAGERSIVSDPLSGQLRLFDRQGDWLQRRPLPDDPTARQALARRANDAARLNDHLLRMGLIWTRRAGVH